MKKAALFQKKSEEKAFDLKHRNTINFNISKYDTSVAKGMQEYENHDLAKNRASYIKTNTIENLYKLLLQFEENFIKNGGKIIWAATIEDAQKAIQKIIEEKNAKSVVKSKSMTTEEIHLNEFLENIKVEVIETDLGEYIVQLAGQKPYHIVTPAMHLSKKDVSDIFQEKLNTPPTDDAQELTGTARRLLRQKYVHAEIGITGANFMIANIGGIAITENEGNARLSTAFPKTHIAIVGIEKMLPKLQDLSLFWPLLAASGTGQRVTVYNSIFCGPKKPHEIDGPEEMYLILLDNGRSELLADTQKRQALNCIRCGACLNACPVYKNIGGHTYNTTYSGPIGSVITPHLEGLKNFKHLSFASSLCGACGTVCPVKIDLPKLLVLNRKQSVEENLSPRSEKLGFQFWKQAMKRRSLMNTVNGKLKNFLVKNLFSKSWGKKRNLPQIATKSFNELWQNKQKHNK